MLFNSIEFAFFFPLVCALAFTLPRRWRLPMLLVASCAFYMAFIPAYILILFVTILIDYAAGIWIEKSRGPARKYLLCGSIVATCAVLFVFKYYNFFTGNFAVLSNWFGLNLGWTAQNIILPIGLSFHTFQSLSYVIEVYKERQKAEHNFVAYATYVMFFPQLVAGPIERPQNLLHQFYESHEFEYDRVASGLKRMAWGFFKKLVVADRLALYVNDVYGHPQAHNGLQLTLGTFFFAYQIYCDFSGYSDIAIGSARVLGFRLMENFETPYYSRSVSEFWRRWHISLSTWFKDYVYVPLGGSRVSTPRWCANVLVTFGISGLWHGANWTYVLWGLLNGCYLIFGQFSKGLRNRALGLIGLTEDSWARRTLMLLTTFGLTCAAWVLFRANSLRDAIHIYTHLWKGWDFGGIRTEQFLLRQLPVALGGIAFLEVAQFLNAKIRLADLIAATPMPARWSVYIGAFLAVILFGVYRKSQFIYFQF